VGAGRVDFGVQVTRANVPFEPGGDIEVPEPASAALGLSALLLRRRRHHAA